MIYSLCVTNNNGVIELLTQAHLLVLPHGFNRVDCKVVSILPFYQDQKKLMTHSLHKLYLCPNHIHLLLHCWMLKEQITISHLLSQNQQEYSEYLCMYVFYSDRIYFTTTDSIINIWIFFSAKIFNIFLLYLLRNYTSQQTKEK